MSTLIRILRRSKYAGSLILSLVGILLIFCDGECAIADLSVNGGSAETINTLVVGTVYVGPNPATILDVVTNGAIDANAITNSEAAAVSISGGVVNLSGGSVVGFSIPAGQTGVSDAIYFNNTGNGGTVNISGGTVSAGASGSNSSTSNAIDVNNRAANITMSGGTVSGAGNGDDINLNFGGTFTMTGGTLQSGPSGNAIFNRGLVNIYGGTIDGGILNQGGAVNIYGGSFNYQFGPISSSYGTLVGTLSDGSPIDAGFDNELKSGSFVLIQTQAIPEPSGLVNVTIGAVGLLNRRQQNRHRKFQ